MGDAPTWQLQTMSGGGPLCLPKNFNGDVEYGPFDAQDCAKEITTDEFADIMEVVFEVIVDPTDGEVTFQYDHHYQITCRYSTTDTLQASFVPLHSVASEQEGEKWEKQWAR